MPQRVQGTLTPARPLGGGVLGLSIVLDEAAPAAFDAGQYLLIEHPDGTPIPFSIASPPCALPLLELHYRPMPGNDDARRMDALVENPGPIVLDLPHGSCGVRAPLPRPLVMIAGGTGIAQARSIALELAHRDRGGAALHLYWGGADAEALYARREFDVLAAQIPEFSWVGVSEGSEPGLRSGRAADAVADDLDSGRIDADTMDFLICGAPAMVWGTVERLRAHGLTQGRTRSDVFDYAPRDDLWG